ncbi:hypothetical protein [Dermacoccus nishinomiyaensis]|uniref:hypothetical protein n=1 Tax=Dermacoccus nishinomiyaensis TaxID=1274 RepID=UPI0016425329|nr:hypothetical protein [Dermacoccus nishinomiyaensis]
MKEWVGKEGGMRLELRGRRGWWVKVVEVLLGMMRGEGMGGGWLERVKEVVRGMRTLMEGWKEGWEGLMWRKRGEEMVGEGSGERS